MNIKLSYEQISWLEEVRDFVDKEILPFAEQFDREEKLPPEIVQKLAGKKFLASMMPVEYGGQAMGAIDIGLLNEEIGRGCSSVRSILTVQGMIATAILRWGSKEQQEYWLPRLTSGEVMAAFGLSEPEVGSDAKSITTTATPKGKNYILNGKKKWITLGQIADLFLIFAKCRDRLTALLVEKGTPGLSIKPITGMLGIRASMIAELTFDNCRIPQENIIGSEGTGFSHVAQSCLDYGRYTVAWGCVGIGQACLDDCIAYARERQQYGQPISKHQLIQKIITEMLVNINAARLLCYNAGVLKEAGDPDSIIETWSAKYFTSKMLAKVTSSAVQIFGANGCCREYPLERHYRDAKIYEIIEGTTQMHEIVIAAHTLRS